MFLATKLVTADEFYDFIEQPENRERRFERIGGRIVEKGVAGGSASLIALIIGRYLLVAIYDTGLGIVTGPDGGYIVSGEQYIPDVAVLLKKNQPKPTYKNGYNTQAPDLAVEVLSPTDRLTDFTTKISNYNLAGTVVWLVNPEDRTVRVHVPGQSPQILTVNDMLTGGDVIPNFSLLVKDIFPEEE